MLDSNRLFSNSSINKQSCFSNVLLLMLLLYIVKLYDGTFMALMSQYLVKSNFN
ncbi:hypothetical protein MOUN0_E05160 [Monosporozyma unispora]